MKKLLFLGALSIVLFSCSEGKDEDSKKDSESAEFDQCECLHASLADRSKECTQWRQTVMNDIKTDLGIDENNMDADAIDAIDAELEKRKAECN